MRIQGLLCLTVVAVAGCAEPKQVERFAGGARVSLATGPISKACTTSDRRDANKMVCGCIQSIANQSLTSADQKLAATFYDDPQKAQDVKMSKSSSHDAFWDRYKVYASRSERSCKGF